MRQIPQEAGVDPACYAAVTDLRVQTTTSLCPYLRPADQGVSTNEEAP
jgi:hypothetical protein